MNLHSRQANEFVRIEAAKQLMDLEREHATGRRRAGRRGLETLASNDAKVVGKTARAL